MGTEVTEEHTASIFRVEDGGNTFHRNVEPHLQAHTKSQPRRPQQTSNWLVFSLVILGCTTAQKIIKI
jgi:hypothetical protein